VGSAAVALSPDGKNAYVASSSWNSLSVITRNPADGTLAPISSQAGCFYSNSSTFTSNYAACTQGRELAGADAVAVSPDGKNVYVASPSDSAVVVFDRDPVTGELTLSSGVDGCINSDGSNSCTSGLALEAATSVTVSPDGKNVYVASSGPNGGIAVFDRDPGTGDLTQKSLDEGCINESGANGCAVGLNQILGVGDIAVSPDGKTVYAVSSTRNAVTIYARDESTGALTPLPVPAGCIKEGGGGGCQAGIAMIAPVALTISPDGGTAYVAGERSESIAVFDRNLTNGELTQKPGTAGCVSNTGFSDPMQAGTAGACQEGFAMDGINSIAVLPDGTALYATAGNSSGVTVFERHPDGTLTQRPGSVGCITETGYENTSLPWTAGACEQGSALQNANDVITSTDSKFVYTAAQNGGVGIFDVVPEPTPPPPSPSSPPPPPVVNQAAIECGRARGKLSQAEQQLKLAHAAVRSQTQAARHTGNISVKHRLARAIQKSRRTVGLWTQKKINAELGVQSFCA